MNRYSSMIEKKWRETAPANYSEIDQPVEFFTDLGKQVAAEIDSILPSLQKEAQTAPYLKRVGLLRNAQLQAEEIAMSNVPWPTLEMSETEAREEWAMGGPSEDNLWQLLGYDPEQISSHLPHYSETYLISEEWMRQFARAEEPATFWEQSRSMLEAAAEARFQRWKSDGYPPID